MVPRAPWSWLADWAAASCCTCARLLHFTFCNAAGHASPLHPTCGPLWLRYCETVRPYFASSSAAAAARTAFCCSSCGGYGDGGGGGSGQSVCVGGRSSPRSCVQCTREVRDGGGSGRCSGGGGGHTASGSGLAGSVGRARGLDAAQRICVPAGGHIHCVCVCVCMCACGGVYVSGRGGACGGYRRATGKGREGETGPHLFLQSVREGKVC